MDYIEKASADNKGRHRYPIITGTQVRIPECAFDQDEEDIDAVRETASTGKDIYAVKAAIEKLIQSNHYATRMDKFITYGAPDWLIGKNTTDEDAGAATDYSISKRALALHRIGLCALATDPDEMVRAAVAFTGYQTKKMVHDKSSYVRAAAAYAAKNEDLEILAEDKSDRVRANVALTGAYIDFLLNDRSAIVRQAVAQKVDSAQLPKMISDESAKVREEVAKRGIGINILVQDDDPMVRMTAAEAIIRSNAEKANLELATSPDECVRKALAHAEYHYQILSQDTSPQVRAIVAQHGYEPKKMAKDKSPLVRLAVAATGYGAGQFKNDKSTEVRIKLASDGYNPFEMCRDESPRVRGTVALYGNELSLLSHDNNEDVRKIASAIRSGDYRKANTIYTHLLKEKQEGACGTE